MQAEGFYRGPIDGDLGSQTFAAVTAYQTSRGFSTVTSGNTITLQTVDALGVDWRSMVSTTTTGSTGFSTGSTSFGGSGATGGFSTGTVTSTGGYTVGSDNLVRDASGVVIGTLQSNGNVVNSAGVSSYKASQQRVQLVQLAVSSQVAASQQAVRQLVVYPLAVSSQVAVYKLVTSQSVQTDLS